MKINSKEELDTLLDYCSVTPYSDVKDGGSFYTIKSQSFLFPDGSIQTREYIDKRKASIVVPITKDGNIVFIIQPTALSEEGALIEFPAGYWEFNENGSQAGKRELIEETGYVPEKIIYLGSHYQDPGSIRQKVEIYLALGCKRLNEQHLDKGEFIKFVEIPYDMALKLLEDGYLKDANSYIAFSKSDSFYKKNIKTNNIDQLNEKKDKSYKYLHHSHQID